MTDLTRREILVAGSAGMALAAGLSCRARDPARTSFDLEETSIDELQLAMRQRRLSAAELTRAYLRQIAEVNQRGPALRAVIATNPNAVGDATLLDEERAGGTVRGALHGIPVLLKDNIATAGPMPTTVGSLLLEDWIAPRDAALVTRLRAAGAIILGKTNLSEWANMRSPHSTSGWSAVGGSCRNPYALERSPCGSSSGSAVAVSANLCAVAVGTETDGSVVCPSAINGIVGIKPTVGAVSRTGIVPISRSQDTAGPMARTVTDAALLLSGMSGLDATDPASRDRLAGVKWDFNRNGLDGVRLGVARQFCKPHPKISAVLDEALGTLERLGAELIDPVELPSEPVGTHEVEVLLHELKADLAAFFSGFGANAPVKTLADLIAGNQRLAERELAWFGQELFERAEEKGPLTDEIYVHALAACREQTRGGLSKALAEVDALVATTAPPAWLIDLPMGDFGFGGGCRCPEWTSTYPAVSGWPHITVPAGFVHGLPIGLSFFAGAWSEPKLVAMAYAFEQGMRARTPPAFAATTV